MKLTWRDMRWIVIEADRLVGEAIAAKIGGTEIDEETLYGELLKRFNERNNEDR